MTQLALQLIIVAFLFALGGVPRADAQTPPAPQAATETPRVLPMRVQVVIARYEGEKRVSSLPYTMSLNAATTGVAQIRMGADVPISTAVIEEQKPGTGGVKVSYDQIGTNIDCRVRPTDDRRYIVELTISEKSVYAEGQGPQVARPRGNPTFRSFRTHNTVILRDGQSAEFAAAGDRMTGEVVRVEVSLQLIK